MSEFDRTLELLRSLNRQLDEYERTQDRSLLVNLQAEIRKAKPQLERVVQNPEYKTSVDSDRFFEFKDEMKRLIERSKKYGVLGNQKIDAKPSQPEKRNSFRSVFNSKDNSSSEENGSSSSLKTSKISFAPGTIDLIDNPVDVRAKPPPLKGWLRKQGEDLFKVNKRRWFEQRLWKVEYFKSDQKRSASDALGHIEFASMQKIEILKEPKFGFHLCTEFRMFVLAAETQQEFEEIVRGIVEWKSYYDNENKETKPSPREAKEKIHEYQENQQEDVVIPRSSGFGKVAEEARLSSSRDYHEESNNERKSPEPERPVTPRKSPTISKEDSSLGASAPLSASEGQAGGDEGALREEIASLKERLAKEEKRGNEARALLAEKEKQLISTKAMLDVSTESQQCDRTLKSNLESDFTQLQTRYEVEKRTWKEERHKREEEAADSRREMASLMAAQRTTEDENNRLKEELRTMESKVSEMKKGNKGGGSSTSRLSVRMQNDHADELKKVKTELIILQQHEKEERITRRQVEEERDVLQEKLEIETKKRERAEERRKSEEGELVKANSDVEMLKRKNAELEGFITRLERNLEEKTKKEAGFQQQIKELQMQSQLAGKLVEKAKEELEDPELYKQVTDLAEEGFSSEQVGKVVQFIGQYLEKYADVEEQLFVSQDHTSELEEAVDGAEQQLVELRGEYDKLLKEYAAKDQYVNALKARGGAEKQRGGGDKLAMQLENMQERCLASQSQVALLSHQLSLNQGEAKATILAKEKAIAGLRKDLGELRKQYQDLRQSILLRSGASEVELEELSDIKQELFVNLAVFTKMNLAAGGVHCNEHVLDLYEEAKDLDYREWKAWIHDRYQGGSGKLQRDYARHSASTPSYSSSARSPSSSSSSSSSPGLATTKSTNPRATSTRTTTTTKSSSPSRTSQPGEAKKVKKVVKKKKSNVVELS